MILNLPSNDATPENSGDEASAQCDRATSSHELRSPVEITPNPIVAGHPSPSSRSDVAPTASTPLIFAATDHVRLGRLPEAAADELRRTFKALEWIHGQPNKNAAFKLMALKCLHEPGFSAASLRRKYYTFLDTRDWTTLVNKAKAGPDWWRCDKPAGLPAAFIEFWKTLCERNQRKCKPAHRELLKIWRTKSDSLGTTYKSIPGYESSSACSVAAPSVSSVLLPSSWPPAHDNTGIPAGWSYENLQRLAPDDYELAASRQGLFAASKHRRKVFTTREGLAVGQFIFFDDQVYDHKVIFTSSAGQASRPMRPRGYDALDLYSACFIAHLFKPTLLHPDAPEQELHLSSKKEFPWFIAEVLCGTGYHPVTGTTFVVEHGTASISPALEERLLQATAGLVTVDRSGLFRKGSHAGLFEGSSRGNPRMKAPLESVFQLVRNNMAMLPGQTGKDRDHCPDQLHGAERYDARLVRCLPPELLRQAQRPFHEWPEFVHLALDIYHAMDSRIDHALEGWGKLTASEWRFSPNSQWEPMSNFERLSPQMQMALAEEFRGDRAALVRSRKLSPREVFSAGARHLQKLPLDLVPYLLGADLATERTVRDGYITLHDQEAGPDPLRFPSYPLRNGEKYLTYLMGSAPVSGAAAGVSPGGLVGPGLIIADASNRYLTTLALQPTPSRADVAGVTRQIAAAKKEEAARLEPLQRRHIPEGQAKTRMHRHNAGLAELASGTRTPRTAEERSTDRAIDAALAENASPDEALSDPLPICETSNPTIDPEKDYE